MTFFDETNIRATKIIVYSRIESVKFGNLYISLDTEVSELANAWLTSYKLKRDCKCKISKCRPNEGI